MRGMRHIPGSRPWLALLVVLAALSARLMVPAGFMPVHEGGRTLILPCTGHGPMAMAVPVHGHGMPQPASQIDPPCGFGGFVQATGAADPVVLRSIHVATGAALGAMAPSRAPIARAIRLRPPSRAPPALPRFA